MLGLLGPWASKKPADLGGRTVWGEKGGCLHPSAHILHWPKTHSMRHYCPFSLYLATRILAILEGPDQMLPFYKDVSSLLANMWLHLPETLTYFLCTCLRTFFTNLYNYYFHIVAPLKTRTMTFILVVP